MAKTLNDYLNLIPTQHRSRPKFIEWSTAIINEYLGIQETIESIPECFDVDVAIGVQLDVCGKWVGISRELIEPLTGVYFTWDGIETEYWDEGTWQSDFDPDSGIVLMNDEQYRLAIKAKIAANHWDGSIPDAYRVWEEAFGEDGPFLIIIDNQDMSMDVVLSGFDFSSADKQIIVNNDLILRPEGVRIRNYFIVDSGPAFMWDVDDNEAAGGWDYGYWGDEFNN